MGERTKIAWTDHTFNLAWGCEKISPGCALCYADSLSARYGFDVWGADKTRRTFGPKQWLEPIKWNRAAEKDGRRHRVFCSSMTDWCLNDAAIAAEREKLWPLIRYTPWLDWQLLTKRADRIKECLPTDWSVATYPNVWLGVSVEDRRHGLPRIPILTSIPASVRFLSCEPLLEDIGEDALLLNGVDWVIVGGESGPNYRPMADDWVRNIRDHCSAHSVAFFYKQPAAARPGKLALLDDRTYYEFPTLLGVC